MLVQLSLATSHKPHARTRAACSSKQRVLMQGGRQVARVLALVPPWVRIYRIQRDIPMPLVTSGVEKGNLRELALARMGQLGLRCRDVRTREAGIQVHCRPCSCARCACTAVSRFCARLVFRMTHWLKFQG